MIIAIKSLMLILAHEKQVVKNSRGDSSCLLSAGRRGTEDGDRRDGDRADCPKTRLPKSISEILLYMNISIYGIMIIGGNLYAICKIC